MKASLLLLLATVGLCQAFHIKTLEEVEPVEEVIEPMQKHDLTVEEEAYENEGRALSAQEFDKVAFFEMLETLLWDADEDAEVSNEDGRQMRLYRRRGLLRMQKPDMLRDEEGFAGRMYRNLQDACYTGFCNLGLGGLPTAFFDLFSAIFK